MPRDDGRLFGKTELLKCPDALKPAISRQLTPPVGPRVKLCPIRNPLTHAKAFAFCCVTVVEGKLIVIFIQLPNSPRESKQPDIPRLARTQPDDDLFCEKVDVFHQRNLRRFLVGGRLVDANGVHPQLARLKWEAEVLQRQPAVWRYHDCFAIAVDGFGPVCLAIAVDGFGAVCLAIAVDGFGAVFLAPDVREGLVVEGGARVWDFVEVHQFLVGLDVFVDGEVGYFEPYRVVFAP